MATKLYSLLAILSLIGSKGEGDKHPPKSIKRYSVVVSVDENLSFKDSYIDSSNILNIVTQPPMCASCFK